MQFEAFRTLEHFSINNALFSSQNIEILLQSKSLLQGFWNFHPRLYTFIGIEMKFMQKENCGQCNVDFLDSNAQI